MAYAHITMRSTVLRMDVKVTVIIPESRRDYREDPVDKKYKSLYILHGGSEDDSTWLAMSNIYLLTRDLDCFVIMPSGYNSSWVDTEYGLKVQTFISEELPAKMERLFPISDKREDRYIMGESMGGYGTWYTSLLHPDRYAKAVVLSGSGYIMQGPLPNTTGAKSLDVLAKERNDSGVELPEYYCMCGSEDYGAEIRKKFEQFVRENCPNIKMKTEYWPGKHDFFFWNQAVPKALGFFGFRLDPEKVAHI